MNCARSRGIEVRALLWTTNYTIDHIRGERRTFSPTHHGYHEYLLSRRPAALILERGRYRPCFQTKTYPKREQAPSPHFPYPDPVQVCRGLCC